MFYKIVIPFLLPLNTSCPPEIWPELQKARKFAETGFEPDQIKYIEFGQSD